ncbi:MAG TPA: fumarylacetoacetate hydrolase family protein [Alphaproteobacteria bacterium]|nr:fumarylacetoacetate hydrolase family protein [Alphaproteobacteria bacterium]
MARLADYMTAKATLPKDGTAGVLAGRVWLPEVEGPAVVAVRADGVHDISKLAPTVRDLGEAPDAAALVREGKGQRIGTLDEVLANTPPEQRDVRKPWLLAPIDLQAIKAAGVTFPRSMLERVIEEQARGAPEKAEAIRASVQRQLGGDLAKLVPGSPEAAELKRVLIEQGAWSQYLEVGIGPDAEIFTKAQPMSAVGHGMDAGLHPISSWNNPEPEVVLVVNSRGAIVGATLGNDINLRDVEGRSALLLSKAKDNNASTAIGPFIRFFDGKFTLDTVRRIEVSLRVEGEDGFTLAGRSSMSEIARDPQDLVRQLLGRHHQYPDGAVLFLGTMFAPVEDRGAKGQGFTHKVGDVTTIAAPELGALANRMTLSTEAAPWEFGTGALMRNLAKRGLL